MNRIAALCVAAATLSLSACDLAPSYVRPVGDVVPAQWPQGAAYPPATGNRAGLSWQQLVTDTNLRRVLMQALAHNQDLAAAVANVAAARAQYRIQRSVQRPTLDAGASTSVQRTITGDGRASGGSTTNFAGDIGISGFEIDLFGRQKNLSRKAFEQYLATKSGARSTRLSVVAETANAYVTFAADRELLGIARQQVDSSLRSVALTEDLHRHGLVSGADVASAQTVLEQARSDVASQTTQVAQDRNGLELLVGRPVVDGDLPASLGELEAGLSTPPAGLSSAVLLERPDVLEAEHQLKAANFDIGAARAAFFPTISLTTALGFATDALSRLFSGSSSYWSATPSASIPILGGPNRGNLAYSKAQRDASLATYRKAIQTAYRDVADALARRGTIAAQRQAQSELVAASQRSLTIGEARYREGIDSFLQVLVAQRTLYSARQTRTSTMLADLSNRITLYSAIGVDRSL